MVEIYQCELERLRRRRVRHPPSSLSHHRSARDTLQASRYSPVSAQSHRTSARHRLVSALGHDRRVQRRRRQRAHMASRSQRFRRVELGWLDARRLFTCTAHQRIAAKSRPGALAPSCAACPRERRGRPHRETVGPGRARISTCCTLRPR